jgi:hypothetical protein
MDDEAGPPKSQQNAHHSGLNRPGVTIAPGLLGTRGPKPFTTAGREASQTSVPKGGMGSWDLAGLCVSAMAGEQAAPDDENQPFQFLDPGDIDLDWDALRASLGVGASTMMPGAQGETNQPADGG